MIESVKSLSNLMDMMEESFDLENKKFKEKQQEESMNMMYD